MGEKDGGFSSSTIGAGGSATAGTTSASSLGTGGSSDDASGSEKSSSSVGSGGSAAAGVPEPRVRPEHWDSRERRRTKQEAAAFPFPSHVSKTHAEAA